MSGVRGSGKALSGKVSSCKALSAKADPAGAEIGPGSKRFSNPNQGVRVRKHPRRKAQIFIKPLSIFDIYGSLRDGPHADVIQTAVKSV